MRPETKSISMIMDIMNKFSRTRELVMDIFAETFATGKAWLMLSRHHRFVGCEIDAKCCEVSLEGFLETYARQVSTDQWDITEGDDLVDVCKAVVQGWRE